MKVLALTLSCLALAGPAHAQMSARDQALCSRDEHLIAKVDQAINEPRSKPVIVDLLFRDECRGFNRQTVAGLKGCRDHLWDTLPAICEE